ncbi:PGC-1 family member spargel isoform X2 [Rhynchophorus ferrugineus]|uniref:PGC-1 family member spargel isoform X2 n=1 Tax=Rhynchophorus ferrugineus TaxID=354439 RepID=UPI003FCDE92A
MDIGLYRGDEQFSFSSSSNTETYSSDLSSFESFGQSEFFDQIMPEPPSDIFEWSNETDKGLNIINTAHIDHTICADDEVNAPQSPTLSLAYKDLDNIDNVWQNEWASITNDDVQLEDILYLPDIVGNMHDLQFTDIHKTDLIGDNKIQVYSSKEIMDNRRISRSSESSDLLNVSFSSTDMTNFDIAEYIFEENKQSKQSIEPECHDDKEGKKQERNTAPFIEPRNIGAGRKKIDLKAQKYIVENDIKKRSVVSDDECDVDIETVSEDERETVLEAGDLTSLLEKFEATEGGSRGEKMLNLKVKVELESKVDLWPKTKEKNVKNEWPEKPYISNGQKHKVVREQNNRISRNEKHDRQGEKTRNHQGMVKKDQRRSPTSIRSSDLLKGKPLLNSINKSGSYSNFKSTRTVNANAPAAVPSATKSEIRNKIAVITNTKPVITPMTANSRTTTSSTPTPVNNGQINKPLSQELINRIKETGKRKPITIIQAIPNKRIKTNKIPELHKTTVQAAKSDSVRLDHNYCSTVASNNKDSGFISEEEDRTIISRQPTVKNADGTLMVSLLKANTIHHLEPACNKKKLNLDEYKRRKNLLVPKSRSECSSPKSNVCDSPPQQEDEQQRILRHQAKLQKMAQEVLNTAPKSDRKPDIVSNKSPCPGIVVGSPVFGIKAEPMVKQEILDPESMIPEPPAKMRRIELVSFGVNTDFNVTEDSDPLRRAVKLAEIKPLLEKVSGIINDNSLISSVIENIPKMIELKARKQENLSTEGHLASSQTHGEDKQIVYVEIGREKCPTRDVLTQTNLSLIGQKRQERIRERSNSSSSSSSYNSRDSNRSKRSRHDSFSSSSSCSSSSSMSSTRSYYSRQTSSRSRSRSPRYKRRNNTNTDRDHLNAVEERRIIYVGRVVTGTTKEDLRKKFQKFGPINKISLHFRDIGENYGFVTFRYKEDAHAAYEHGNDDPDYPYYKISFGGRREFCQSAYSDLDNMRDDSYYQSKQTDDSYDRLLKDALETLKKRNA